MPPKQQNVETYLSTDADLDGPPKRRWGMNDEAGGDAVSLPPSAPAALMRRYRSVSGGSPSRPAAGFLLYSAGGSSADEADDDWEQNSLGSRDSPPTGGRRRPIVPDPVTQIVAASAGPMRRVSSSPSFKRGGGESSSPASAAVPFRVFVLLLRPRDKIFELVRVEYDPSRATVGDVLDLIPGSATEPRLGNQRHVGLMRRSDGTVLTDRTVPASPSVLCPDGADTANVKRGDILVAIPEGYDGSKCRQLSDKILRNPKMAKLLRRMDPLRPRRSRSGGSSSSSSASASSSASMGSGGGGGRSAFSSLSPPGHKRRSSCRRVACVPPTVMEEGEQDAQQQQQQQQQQHGADCHSLSTAPVRNNRHMDAIAELLSRDSDAERRRRLETERVRREAEERKRREAEELAQERIRRVIEERARAQEAERRRREEEKGERARRESERISELARRAEEAERAWEQIRQRSEASLSPPSSPRSAPRKTVSLTRRPSAGDLSVLSCPPEEVEISAAAAASVSSAVAGPDTKPPLKGGAGLEMFLFGMLSSTVMVIFAARAMNQQPHPEVVLSSAAIRPQGHEESAEDYDEAAASNPHQRTGLSFLLQFAVLFFLLNRAQRSIRRKIRSQGGGLSKIARRGSSHDLAALQRARRGSSHDLMALQRQGSRRLEMAAAAAARRPDYGYGSGGGGSSWREAANL